MEIKNILKESVIVLVAALVLSATISFKENSLLLYSAISFLIIISANVITKKIIGYFLEIGIKIKFWEWYHYGLKSSSHFKRPIPMLWFPLILSLISKGMAWWLAILEFDVTAKVERVSKRHGLYRFTEVTEWHVGAIAFWAIIVNVILALIAYFAGFEMFTKLSIYFVAWSIIPLSSLDGTKIFFASRKIWATMALIIGVLTVWGIAIV
ncbi:MAG: hypothetical protein WC548_04685 [Candidatus Pacearchaeota archaeon]